MRRPLGVVLATAATSGVLVVLGAPAQADPPDGTPCAAIDEADVQSEAPTEPSAPIVALDVVAAQDIVRQRTGAVPGTGVRVAVIDSGVSTPGVTEFGSVRAEEFSAVAEPTFYHGTAMAGVIAGRPQDDGVGPIGIAPGAEVYDVRVYDSDTSDNGLKTPTEGGIVAGLDAVAGLAGTRPGQVRIVNVSLTVDQPSDALEAAVERVTRTGAIVVASTGNRVSETEADATDGEDGDEGGYEFGEDVVRWPAGYARTNPRVVAVGTTTDPTYEEPAEPAGLLSSAIDVVVPTFGSVTYAVNGSTCSFDRSSTSVAAAQVSGILALLASAFPDDTAEQLIARLETTATGDEPTRGGAVDRFRGRGVVQPVEALTRPLRPGRDGTIAPGPGAPDRAEPAPLPRAEPDVLEGTRRDAVWWGLFGGGALVVALLLRPVLSRRRGRA